MLTEISQGKRTLISIRYIVIYDTVIMYFDKSPAYLKVIILSVYFFLSITRIEGDIFYAANQNGYAWLQYPV